MSKFFLLTILPLSKLSKLKEIPDALRNFCDILQQLKKWNVSNGWTCFIILLVIVGFVMYCFGDDSDEEKKK